MLFQTAGEPGALINVAEINAVEDRGGDAVILLGAGPEIRIGGQRGDGFEEILKDLA